MITIPGNPQTRKNSVKARLKISHRTATTYGRVADKVVSSPYVWSTLPRIAPSRDASIIAVDFVRVGVGS